MTAAYAYKGSWFGITKRALWSNAGKDSWNSMIVGCQQSGESALAIELFKDMLANRDLKDEITMVSVINLSP